MIKIKIDPDSAAINQIYGEEGALVASIEQEISIQYEKGNGLIQRLLEDWFYRGKEISKEKVSTYLKDPHTRGRIDEFAKKVCKIEWGNEAFAKVFLLYHADAKKPRKTASKKQQKSEDKEPEESRLRLIQLEKLRKDLKEAPDAARMFEVVSKDRSSFRPLTPDEAVKSNPEKISVTLSREKSAEIDALFEACKTIFNYDTFSDSYRDDVLNAINVSVCPYCNRQYITAFETGGKRKNTGDIEHFYDKSTYPFLALSLYNFVPSCQICNSRFKGTKDFYLTPHLNPYLKSFGSDARFEIRNLNAITDKNEEPDVELHIDPKAEEIRNSVNTFHIKELYKNHIDYMKEIIHKRRIFSESQLKEYLEEYEGLFDSKTELYRIIYGNYLEEENQGKRPLSKLTQDLLLDLSEETK